VSVSVSLLNKTNTVVSLLNIKNNAVKLLNKANTVVSLLNIKNKVVKVLNKTNTAVSLLLNITNTVSHFVKVCTFRCHL
jgi:hypothetical protein